MGLAWTFIPPTLVLDEMWVKVGGRDCWIFTALDPETWQVIYLEPFFQRDAKSVRAFIQSFVPEVSFGA